ncbi:TraI domain-containing protein [Salmonella enterica]|nr:TraI domain-containing protein [Salmonella enterica]ELW6563309.1 TraI domain-containing protein [Salmonella enterica]ELZ1404528.1 TraI domain-containing protein [Salmonella enterica]
MWRKLFGLSAADKGKERTPEERGYLRPLTAEEILDTENRQGLLKQIRDNSLMTKEGTEQYYLQPLRHCVNLMQLLPATEKAHHAVVGGLVDFTLTTVAYALRLSRGSMLPQGAGAEEQSAQAATWNAVIFYAALCRSLTVFGLLEGELADGTLWSPGLVVPSQPYRLRFCKDREERAQALAVLLGMRLLPEDVVVWLGRTPAALDTLLRIIRGEDSPGCVVSKIISEAAELAGGQPAEARKTPQPVISAPVVPAPVPVASAAQQGTVIPAAGQEQAAVAAPDTGIMLGSALNGTTVAGTENIVVPTATQPASVPEEQADQTIGNVMALMGFSTQPEPAGTDISVPGNSESAVAERIAESGADLQGKTEKHEKCGELFWQWLRNGVRTGSISVNRPDSLAHITGGMLFIPTPEIFFAFLKDSPEIIPGTSRDDIQREFEKLGRNFCRRDNALFQCQKYEEENRQGRYKRWSGYLIKARQIYTGEEVPGDGMYLFVSRV